MPVILAVANQKGGVGKTTISTQLAFDLTYRRDKKVLFVDMDSQGNATSTLLQGREITGTPASDLFDEELESITPTPTEHGIDVLATPPNDEWSYSIEAFDPETFMGIPKRNLSLIADNYDVVIIDCPPNLGLKLKASLIAATHVVCPIKLCGYAFDGLAGLLDTITSIQATENKTLSLLGALVNSYDMSPHNQKMLELIHDTLHATVLVNKIRHRTPLDRANTEGIPIWKVPGGYRAAEELSQVFRELYAKIGDGFADVK